MPNVYLCLCCCIIYFNFRSKDENGENVATFDQKELDFFWTLIHSHWKIKENPYFHSEKGKYKIERILGVAASSTVLKCTMDGEAYAVKIGPEGELASEKIFHDELKELDPDLVLPILDTTYSGGLVYPMGNPIVLSNWGLKSDVKNMTREQCYNLYLKLLKFHSKNILHRDLRPENVIIWNEKAFLIDLSYATSAVGAIPFAGSVVTASQRVLFEIGNSNQNFPYTKKDDLESFYKLAFRYFTPFVLPPKCENPALDAQQLYRAWAEKPNVGALEDIESYEEMCKYLKGALFAKMNIDVLFQAVNIGPPQTPKRAKRVRSPLAVTATQGTPHEKR